MMDLVSMINESIRRYGLFEPDESLLLGVSGGVDSMSLLDMFHEMSHRWGWRLAVAHFNHQLRGKDSDQDEALVQRIASEKGLEFVSDRRDVAAHAGERRISVEMSARELRHRFFADAASRRRIKKIVLAHHADDQVELFFLRVLRGAGGRGGQGMRWITPSPANHDLVVVRPFLNLTKQRILDYARARDLPFREDRTNLQMNASRNRIRHRLIPKIQAEFGDGFLKTVPRLMETIGAEHDFVNQAASEWLKNPCGVFSELHPAVQRQVVVNELRMLGIEPDYHLVENLCLKTDTCVSVGSGILIRRAESGKLEILRADQLEVNPNEITVPLTGDRGRIEFDSVRIQWSLASCDSDSRLPDDAGEKNECFDADKIGNCVMLRHWRPGDRMRPIGMSETVKLQDLFVNNKISRETRRSLTVAEACDGNIFWVENLRIDGRAKRTPKTKRLLHWTWSRRAPV